MREFDKKVFISMANKMLKEKLYDSRLKFTAKEDKICQILLANYPTAGLSTVADLSERAGVSVPTVLRFFSKLGFSGYTDFQKSLVEEIADQFNSPLSLFRERAVEAEDTIYQSTMRTQASALEQLDADFHERDFDATIDMLADERATIHCMGGRFSHVVAERLAQHLAQVRPGVRLLAFNPCNTPDLLVDYNEHVTLVVFDFRRYQPQVIHFAHMAHARGARIVLFTDRWQSPIAKFANRILISPVESNSPFDSWIPAIAQTDAIVASVADRNADKTRKRLAAIEAVREEFMDGV